MFEDQTVELLPERTVMGTWWSFQDFNVGGDGGTGGNGGAGGNGGNGGIAIGGVAIAVNAGNINFGDDQYNTAVAYSVAEAGDGGDGGDADGGDGGDGGDVDD
jgi:hypothetical protein